MRSARAMVAGVIAVAAVATVPARAAPYDYHGFRFAVDARGKDSDALLAGARQQVDIVEGVGLTPETLAFLRGYIVQLSKGVGGGHFGRDGVVINLPLKPDDRPILLHEYMHAYQARRLPDGMANSAMRLYFRRAHTPGLWPADSYMLSDEAEFFAMTTSVELYGHADRPPFSRAALEEKQPEYAAWIKANVR